MPNDIAIARYVPPVSVPDMERMAHAIVQSKMYGIQTVPQALTLMWLAQAEGRHPVLAARDYDIIQGKPAKKAEAMMRDFISAGGSVEWHQLDDSVADATFSHPRGGEVRISWDMDRARQAGLLGKAGDMWRKYPRQMLRSRCVSEGIRTVGPMATSGLFVPEEVADYEPRKPRAMKDVTPDAEHPPHDPETGEIVTEMDDGPLYEQALAAADGGTHALRTWLQGCSRPERDKLREVIGTADAPGHVLRRAQEADADAVNIRRETLTTTESPAGVPPADAGTAPAPQQKPAGDTEAIPDMLGGEPRPPASHRWRMPKDPSPRDWQQFADWLDAKLSDGIAGRALRADNETALKRLREADPAAYDVLQEKLTAAR